MGKSPSTLSPLIAWICRRDEEVVSHDKGESRGGNRGSDEGLEGIEDEGEGVEEWEGIVRGSDEVREVGGIEEGRGIRE